MKDFFKEIQCFFDDKSREKLILGNQTIDFFPLEKKNCEVIEYTICYAILTSLTDRDIGYLSELEALHECYLQDRSVFPFIEKILGYILKENLVITNISIHLTAQKPRLCRTDLNINHKFDIRDYLCEIFNLDENKLVVHAGTGEKIGNTGSAKSLIIICNLGICELAEDNKSLVGFGYDRHRFELDLTKDEKRPTICGQTINYNKSINAHSDGDMVLHALVNAIFSTIGRGDIGEHFPDTDPEWKGANSIKFVTYAMEKLKEKNHKISFIEIILISSERLRDFIEKNHKTFVDDCINLISKICEVTKNEVNFSIRLANEKLIDKDESCIKDDEGIDANVKIYVAKNT